MDGKKSLGEISDQVHVINYDHEKLEASQTDARQWRAARSSIGEKKTIVIEKKALTDVPPQCVGHLALDSTT